MTPKLTHLNKFIPIKKKNSRNSLLNKIKKRSYYTRPNARPRSTF